MKPKRTAVSSVKTIVVAVVCAALAGMFAGVSRVSAADAAAPADLSPATQEVVKLAQAHLGDDVITSYIRNSNASYTLSADDIVYLKAQGVSQNIISLMLQKGPSGAAPAPAAASPAPPPPPSAPGPAPTPTAETEAPPPASPPELGSSPPPSAPVAAPAGEPAPSFDYFQQQLSPYGAWVNVPGYGMCWQPYGIAYGWRPYYDNGYWVYTDAGMYWQSNYAWGAIPFHYGRWSYVTGYGWVWSPAYVYAPAWVVWRHTDDYCGWAPLPYGAVFVDGGWAWHGHHYGADFAFGFGDSFFIFVGYGHLWEHDYHHYTLRGPELHAVFHASVVNRVRVDEHGHFVHEGFDRAHLEHVTGRSITVARHEDIQNHERETMRVDRERVVHGEPRGEVRRDEPYGRDRDQDRGHDRQWP
ncbi:MAG TPA: DUF6600 domain-containing protein [Verrucomicrobiae bacterium]|nr:DUF6600 domain-containing protein [Verrucomicrobiae bacterium]